MDGAGPRYHALASLRVSCLGWLLSVTKELLRFLRLALKLGIRASPRTVRAYWPETLRPNQARSSHRWASFLRNHAKATVACDFVVAVTLRFRVLFVFVVMEIGSRKLLHVT